MQTHNNLLLAPCYSLEPRTTVSVRSMFSRNRGRTRLDEDGDNEPPDYGQSNMQGFQGSGESAQASSDAVPKRRTISFNRKKGTAPSGGGPTPSQPYTVPVSTSGFGSGQALSHEEAARTQASIMQQFSPPNSAPVANDDARQREQEEEELQIALAISMSMAEQETRAAAAAAVPRVDLEDITRAEDEDLKRAIELSRLEAAANEPNLFDVAPAPVTTRASSGFDPLPKMNAQSQQDPFSPSRGSGLEGINFASTPAPAQPPSTGSQFDQFSQPPNQNSFPPQAQDPFPPQAHDPFSQAQNPFPSQAQDPFSQAQNPLKTPSLDQIRSLNLKIRSPGLNLHSLLRLKIRFLLLKIHSLNLKIRSLSLKTRSLLKLKIPFRKADPFADAFSVASSMGLASQPNPFGMGQPAAPTAAPAPAVSMAARRAAESHQPSMTGAPPAAAAGEMGSGMMSGGGGMMGRGGGEMGGMMSGGGGMMGGVGGRMGGGGGEMGGGMMGGGGGMMGGGGGMMGGGGGEMGGRMMGSGGGMTGGGGMMGGGGGMMGGGGGMMGPGGGMMGGGGGGMTGGGGGMMGAGGGMMGAGGGMIGGGIDNSLVTQSGFGNQGAVGLKVLQPFADKLLDANFAKSSLADWHAQFRIFEKQSTFLEDMKRSQEANEGNSPSKPTRGQLGTYLTSHSAEDDFSHQEPQDSSSGSDLLEQLAQLLAGGEVKAKGGKKEAAGKKAAEDAAFSRRRLVAALGGDTDGAESVLLCSVHQSRI
ncbi:hypothetical protein AB1Y20_020432 [Prymnesium parvum]|uniref:Uncharacterized protein n=1 Tax=Prymnesium parvum TaxID=97485 RepID=A0AB34JXC4_PRYPA